MLPGEVRVHAGGPGGGATAAAGADPHPHALHEDCEWIVVAMVGTWTLSTSNCCIRTLASSLSLGLGFVTSGMEMGSGECPKG